MQERELCRYTHVACAWRRIPLLGDQLRHAPLLEHTKGSKEFCRLIVQLDRRELDRHCDKHEHHQTEDSGGRICLRSLTWRECSSTWLVSGDGLKIRPDSSERLRTIQTGRNVRATFSDETMKSCGVRSFNWKTCREAQQETDRTDTHTGSSSNVA